MNHKYESTSETSDFCQEKFKAVAFKPPVYYWHLAKCRTIILMKEFWNYYGIVVDGDDKDNNGSK